MTSPLILGLSPFLEECSLVVLVRRDATLWCAEGYDFAITHHLRRWVQMIVWRDETPCVRLIHKQGVRSELSPTEVDTLGVLSAPWWFSGLNVACINLWVTHFSLRWRINQCRAWCHTSLAASVISIGFVLLNSMVEVLNLQLCIFYFVFFAVCKVVLSLSKTFHHPLGVDWHI